MLRCRLLPLLSVAVICLTFLAEPAAADKPVHSSFDSSGVKIAYFTEGQGPPVVLIHGWTASAVMNWGLPGVSGQLAKDFQVIAMDVRGHGQSDKPTKDEAYGPEVVEDVVRLLDHLKIKKAHIVGYSMGGMITANFLLKHPDRALSGTLGGMGWLKDGAFTQKLVENAGKKQADSPTVVCMRSMAKLALTEAEIKSIKIPVEVLVGDKDDTIRKLYVDPLRKARPDWPVVEIKDATHMTCVVRPQFKDELASWLKKNSK
jgi:pimeloyl-ACP methyl ester carboxylesterase